MFDMLSGITGDLSGLSPEDAQNLATLLERRNEYLGLQQAANRLRIKALTDRTPQSQQELNEYLAGAVASARTRMAEDTKQLVSSAVNVDGMKSLLPMILLGLAQNVNLPLLLTALGADPDMITQMVKQLKGLMSGESEDLS